MRRDALPLLGIVIFSLFLLVVGVWWGLPVAVSPETARPWGYDEIAPIGPLEEMSPFSRSNHGDVLAYPAFHYMPLSLAYAPYLLFHYLGGRLTCPCFSGFPYGMSDPVSMCQALVVIARMVSVAMAAGIIVTIYFFAKTVFDRRAAVWAALMSAVLPSFVYFGKTSNMDIPYTFWLLLAYWSFAGIVLKHKGKGTYVLFGVFSSLAVCTKDQAFGYLFLLPIALLGYRYQRFMAQAFRRRIVSSVLGSEVLLGMAAAFLTFLLANKILFDFEGFQKHLEVGLAFAEIDSTHSPFKGQGVLLKRSLGFVFREMGPAILVAIVGLGYCLRYRRWMPLWILTLPILGHYVFIVFQAGFMYQRYLLPSALLLVVIGGAAIYYASSVRVARLVKGLMVVSVLYGLVVAADINIALVTDARYAAEDWIEEHVEEGSSFEAYQTGQLDFPRVWPKHELSVVDRADMTEEQLHLRDPDYIMITNLDSVEFLRWQYPVAGRFLDNLEAGRFAYKQVAEFKTTRITCFPVGTVMGCIDPHVRIFGREQGLPGD